jgi:RNA polymerase sigma-70 factor (ECF subfamily)
MGAIVRFVSNTRDRTPTLKVVPHTESPRLAPNSQCEGGHAVDAPAALREFDWSILMARAQAGERAAYRRLLDEITPYVRALAAKSHRDPNDVEDTVQDVLLTVHSIRRTYDPTRPFGPWLVAIAHRRIVDRLRRQGRARQHESPLEPEHETLAATGANDPEASVDSTAVRNAVERLPPGQREAIRLMKLQEMSLRQASAISGISIAALKVATHRGLKTLRKLLAGSSTEA